MKTGQNRYIGNRPVVRRYIGSTLVWERTPEGFDTATEAIWNYASAQGYTAPGGAEKVKIDLFIKGLKAAGIWQQLDVLYLFRNGGDENFRLINYKSPGTFNGVWGYGTHASELEGFKATANTYLDTKFNPSTATNIKMTASSCSMGAYVYNSDGATTPKVIFGRVSSGTNFYFLNQSTNDVRLNSVQDNLSSMDIDGVGLKAASKDGGGSFVFSSGSVYPCTFGAESLLVENVYVYRQSSMHSRLGISFVFLGAGLTSSQVQQIETLYLNLISEQPPEESTYSLTIHVEGVEDSYAPIVYNGEVAPNNTIILPSNTVVNAITPTLDGYTFTPELESVTMSEDKTITFMATKNG